MFLNKSEKMVEVQNLLCYCLNIGNNCEGLTPLIRHDSSQFTHCSSLNSLKLACFFVEVQGQFVYRQGPNTQVGSSDLGKPNYLNSCPNYYNNQGYYNNSSSQPKELRKHFEMFHKLQCYGIS